MMKKKIIPLISIILSILLMISCLSLSASASDVMPVATHGGAAPPTDLTGYTVTVPAGWSAYGIGLYDLDYTATGQLANYFSIGIGVSSQGRPADDVYFIPGGDILSNTASFEISITGGDDVSDSSLIQWFVNNNAIFTLTNSDADFPVLPGSYTFNRSDLIASMSGYIGITGLLSHPAITNMDNSVGVLGIYITAGDPGVITLNGIGENYVTSDNIGVWHNAESDLALCPVLDSVLTINETVYSQALLDFLMLNTDYEEVNMPEDPVEYITLPAGVYIFDPVLQVPSNVGVYPIEFRSDGTVFYGISLDAAVLSYGNSSLDAFAPVYDYSDNTWVGSELQLILLEDDQRVDKRLGDYILAETEYLSPEWYQYIYDEGYDSGYDIGYDSGRNLSNTENIFQDFFGNFFGGIVRALDSLVIADVMIGNVGIIVSIWDVISTIISIFIVIIILKVFAGG